LEALCTVPVGAVVLVTLIGPVVAPEGTLALSSVDETWVTTVAGLVLKRTAELVLNPMPVMVTTVPTAPLAGENLVIDSLGVNLVALVPVPAAVVTEIGAATAPLGTTALSSVGETKLTESEATDPKWTLALGTKPEPVMVTCDPVIPDVGLNELTFGAL
jgi:hypothetical protein